MRRQLVAYAIVGVAGTVLDFALLWLLLRGGVWTPAAVTAAFACATSMQFFLNRHWSFRNFDRPVMHQARTYAIVTTINWSIALIFVEAGTQVFHLAPLLAKALAVPPSAIVGFAGNRYVTFGPGIRALYRRSREHGP